MKFLKMAYHSYLATHSWNTKLMYHTFNNKQLFCARYYVYGSMQNISIPVTVLKQALFLAPFYR